MAGHLKYFGPLVRVGAYGNLMKNGILPQLLVVAFLVLMCAWITRQVKTAPGMLPHPNRG